MSNLFNENLWPFVFWILSHKLAHKRYKNMSSWFTFSVYQSLSYGWLCNFPNWGLVHKVNEESMTGIQCQFFGFSENTLDYLRIDFKNCCSWWFYGKTDVKVWFITFVFICSPIWKNHKWVGRSKLISEVNLNMVYRDPMWNHENIYLGVDRRGFLVLFWAQNL